MAPLSVLLALMMAHPGISIISGSGPGQPLEAKSEAQSRRGGVNLNAGPAVGVAEEARDTKDGRGDKRGAQLSGQASHIHSTVYGGHGYGGSGGFDGFSGHHGGGGLGFYGGGSSHGYGGDLSGFGGEGGFGGGHGDFEHHHHLQHHHDPHLQKALAFKSLLVPLAGVALLGAAAAFVTNPILLQLGVVSGRRRRRAAPLPPALHVLSPDQEHMLRMARQRVGDLQVLEHFMAQIPAAEARAQEKRLLASYLTCTGIVPPPQPANASSTDAEPAAAASSPSIAAPTITSAFATAACLERLSCELHQNDTSASGASALERHVMRVVTAEILSNEYIADDVKRNVEKAVRRGKHGDDCAKYYPCQDLDDK